MKPKIQSYTTTGQATSSSRKTKNNLNKNYKATCQHILNLRSK